MGDSNIEGFATEISVNRGQTVSFKIDTDATKYRIDIYRLGYYGGDGATLVTSFNENLGSPQVQPDPLFDPATNEVDAGNWAVSASWAVPSDATSGVYIAKLTRTDGTTGENMIPFIVRADGVASDVVFQTSDTTWQAYNPWGGYNFYSGPGGRNDRAYALSYNRPIDTNSDDNLAGPQDFIFGEELPAIMWLEQNGYDVSYISGLDAATNPGSVLNAKVYMDVGHDEYWSQSQYANVQAAGAAGVNLMFLSGNETYWDIGYAFRASRRAEGTNRTIIEYKDPWNGQQLDPNGSGGDGGARPSATRSMARAAGERRYRHDLPGRRRRHVCRTSNCAHYSNLFIWKNTARGKPDGKPDRHARQPARLRVGFQQQQRLPSGRADKPVRPRRSTSGRSSSTRPAPKKGRARRPTT